MKYCYEKDKYPKKSHIHGVEVSVELGPLLPGHLLRSSWSCDSSPYWARKSLKTDDKSYLSSRRQGWHGAWQERKVQSVSIVSDYLSFQADIKNEKHFFYSQKNVS